MDETPVMRSDHAPERVAHESEFAYLGRQPILARNGALDAYELLFRSGTGNEAIIHNDAQATAQVVANTIGSIGVGAVLGTHRGYVNLCRELLFDDIVHLLPSERFVLEVLETVSVDAQLIDRLGKLRRAGFSVALDDIGEMSDELIEILPHVDIVKVDLLGGQRAQLPAIAEAVRTRGKTLVAEKVETHDDYALACELGFDLFQGYFFARPQVLSARRSDPSRQSLLSVLALIASDAPLPELEAELKRNPDVVLQLLKLVNSIAYGFGRRIGSVREAILAAGTRQVARWAQLLLYALSGEVPWRHDPLTQLAGARSRFMELAAARVRPDDERFVDTAFMTGIFSLVHVLLGEREPADALMRFGLVAEIGNAIIDGVGPLGALLAVAQAAEHGNAEVAARGASIEHPEFAALTPNALAEINLSAAAWLAAHTEVQN
jgi:c-di-GMP-related signal transduction protein